MNSYYFLTALFFILFSCADKAKSQSPEEVLQKSIKILNNWETISFHAKTTNDALRNGGIETFYKLKKVSYEPHLKLFFLKEMNGETTIYYKLASLAVVEDSKKKITVFDYGNDRSIPHYLQTYMGDDDNLIIVGEFLKNNKNTIEYLKSEDLNGSLNYVYAVENYKFWINNTTSIIEKMEITKNASQDVIVEYSDIVFDIQLNDEDFIHPEKEGYVSSVFTVNPEPLLNSMAKNWDLQDVHGETVSLANYKGYNVFLESWISTCHHCIASMPKVKNIVEKFGDKIKVVTVNFDYNLDETKHTIEKYKIDYKVLLGNAQFDKDYDIRTFPSYVIIDKTGKIIFSERGAIEGKKEESLFKAIENLK